MQEPSLGRIILVLTDPAINNGSDVCPAIVTRTWGNEDSPEYYTINYRLMRDGLPAPIDWVTSGRLYEDRTFAEAGLQAKAEELAGSYGGGVNQANAAIRAGSVFAFWPPRVA